MGINIEWNSVAYPPNSTKILDLTTYLLHFSLTPKVAPVKDYQRAQFHGWLAKMRGTIIGNEALRSKGMREMEEARRNRKEKRRRSRQGRFTIFGQSKKRRENVLFRKSQPRSPRTGRALGYYMTQRWPAVARLAEPGGLPSIGLITRSHAPGSDLHLIVGLDTRAICILFHGRLLEHFLVVDDCELKYPCVQYTVKYFFKSNSSTPRRNKYCVVSQGQKPAWHSQNHHSQWVR
jgi:hypothetical protein